MGKEFTTLGDLQGEELSSPVPLHEWLNEVVEKKYNPTKTYNFFKEAGRYFTGPTQPYPEEIVRPENTQRGWCHKNNLDYAELLLKNHSEKIKDFTFVTGLWATKALPGYGLPGKEYHIGAHTFMTYRGLVLDCTAINHPVSFGSIDQYFGISFEIPDVLTNYKKALKKFDMTITPLAEVLINTPYLKE